MNENFKSPIFERTTTSRQHSTRPAHSSSSTPPLVRSLSRQDVTDEDEHVLWEKTDDGEATVLLTTDNMCGLGGCRSAGLQRFATRPVYLAVFCCLAVVQGMFYAYVISILTTVERRFALTSRTIGFLMTAYEFSQIFFAIIVSYYGSKGHRPRWVALGMFSLCIACFICILPEFVLYQPLSSIAPSDDNQAQSSICNTQENEWTSTSVLQVSNLKLW